MGLKRGSLKSNKEFKVTLVYCTTLKSAGESVRTTSLNGADVS